MQDKRRPWSHAEKWLLLTPLLLASCVGVVMAWRRAAPISLQLPDSGSITTFSFSPDGKRLAVLFKDKKGMVVTTGPSGKKNYIGGPMAVGAKVGGVFDVETGAKLSNLAAPTGLTTPHLTFHKLSWSPDGNQVVVGFNDATYGTAKIPTHNRDPKSPKFRVNSIGKIALWNAQSGSLTAQFTVAPRNEESYGGVYFAPDGKTLICELQPPSVLDAATGRRIREYRGTFKRAVAGKVNEKLSMVALQNEDLNHFQVFDLQTNEVLLEQDNAEYAQFKWSGDILGVIIRPKDRPRTNQLLLWNGKTRKLLPSPPPGIDGIIDQFSFSSDGRTVALAYFNYHADAPPERRNAGGLALWDYRANKIVWRRSTDSRLWCQWSANGKWLSTVVTPHRSVPHLLIYDRSGYLRLEREVIADEHVWSSDSTRIAVVGSQRDPARIDVVWVGN